MKAIPLLRGKSLIYTRWDELLFVRAGNVKVPRANAKITSAGFHLTHSLPIKGKYQSAVRPARLLALSQIGTRLVV